MKKLIFLSWFLFFIVNFLSAQVENEMDVEKPKPIIKIQKKKYNPTTATLLSLLIPGAGQIYVDEPGRGLVQFLGTAATTALFFIGSAQKTENLVCSDCPGGSTVVGTTTSTNSPILALFGLASTVTLSIWSMADASRLANSKNNENNDNQMDNDYKNKNYNEEERIKRLEEIKKEMQQSTSFAPIIIQSQNQLFPGLGLSFRF